VISLTQIMEKLERLPIEMARIGELVEKERLEYERKKLECEHFEAQKYLELKAHDPNITATELKYRVRNNDDYYSKQMEVIGQESLYRKKEKEFSSLNERLMSFKRIAQIQMEEMKSIGRSQC